ncbi:MAG TPA: hypothetical protein VG097_00830 [Gemmata sp.]|jgi:hypothetical protein|nr:hypothetical protein [Gemmata sp.]
MSFFFQPILLVLAFLGLGSPFNTLPKADSPDGAFEGSPVEGSPLEICPPPLCPPGGGCPPGFGGAGAAPPTFTIVSITYTNACNKVVTVNFAGACAPPVLPPTAANSQIIINGTYSPASGKVVSTISAGLFTAGPTCKNGNWTVTIPAKTFGVNAQFPVTSTIVMPGGTDVNNAASVNGMQVAVEAQAFQISVNCSCQPMVSDHRRTLKE